MKPIQKINRRSFLNQATTLVVGAGALSNTAFSYNRIPGANDRISPGHGLIKSDAVFGPGPKVR